MFLFFFHFAKIDNNSLFNYYYIVLPTTDSSFCFIYNFVANSDIYTNCTFWSWLLFMILL